MIRETRADKLRETVQEFERYWRATLETPHTLIEKERVEERRTWESENAREESGARNVRTIHEWLQRLIEAYIC